MGNLSERIVGGHGGRVPDFITFDYWPTFNVADACVTVGVIVIMAALLRWPRLRTEAAGTPEGPVSAEARIDPGRRFDGGPGAARRCPGGPGVAMLAGVSARRRAAEFIAAGCSVDGVPVTVGRTRCARVPTVTVRLPRGRDAGVAAEAGRRSFEVVHADEMVAVVDKPAGLVVHPGAGHDAGTLVGGLLDRFPDLAGLVATGSVRGRSTWHRPPPRQGHLGAAGGGPDRGRLPRPRGPIGRPGPWSVATWPSSTVVADDRGEVEAPIGRSTPHADQDGGHGQRASRPGPPTRCSGAAGGEDQTTLLDLSLAERPDPPDPRPHGGHRPPGGGGRPLRAGRTSDWVRGGSSCTPSGWPSSTPGTGARMEFSSPLPADLGPTWISGRLVDAEHVEVEGQGGQGLLLGPAHAAHAHPEPLGRRLQ